MNTFKDLKQARNSQYEKLIEETNKIQNGSRQKDDRFWQPTVDEAGNGSAIIRFLPSPVNEDLPWVRLFSHGFQGPGGWYVENSLTTLGEEDPVSIYNQRLWNNGSEAGKDQARKQKRRLGYVANILVIKDPKASVNEGQVFLYKFGKKIFDKINDCMHPEFDDEEAVNPFDFWNGANLRMKIRNVEGYRNYDKSEFEPISLLSESDEKLEIIWNKQYSLKDFVSKDKFKSFAELETKLKRVLGASSDTTETDNSSARADNNETAPDTKTVAESDGEDDWLKKIEADLEENLPF